MQPTLITFHLAASRTESIRNRADRTRRTPIKIKRGSR